MDEKLPPFIIHSGVPEYITYLNDIFLLIVHDGMTSNELDKQND